MGALSYVCVESVICITNDPFEVLQIPVLTDISSCFVGGRSRIRRMVVSRYKGTDQRSVDGLLKRTEIKVNRVNTTGYVILHPILIYLHFLTATSCDIFRIRTVFNSTSSIGNFSYKRLISAA